MKWYIKVLRQYADFSGRARRMEYWMYGLFNFIISMVMVSIDAALQGGFSEVGFGSFSMVYSLGTFIPSLAVAVRRLHDTNRSGWMLLVALIPIIGSIWLLVLFLTGGDTHENQYGPDPKADPMEGMIDEIGTN